MIVVLLAFKVGLTGLFKSNGLAFIVGETGKQEGDDRSLQIYKFPWKARLIVALSTFKVGSTGLFKSNGLASIVGETGKQNGDKGGRQAVANRQIPIGTGAVT